MKILEIISLFSLFLIISHLIKVSVILILEKSRFSSYFRKILILLKIFDFRFDSKFLKISLMVKIYKNLDFGVKFRKCSVQILGNVDIGQYFRKSCFQPKFRKSRNCQIFGNSIYFCHFFIIPNLVTIMGAFFSLPKITIFLKFYVKSQICSKFQEKFRLWKFCF